MNKKKNDVVLKYALCILIIMPILLLWTLSSSIRKQQNNNQQVVMAMASVQDIDYRQYPQPETIDPIELKQGYKTSVENMFKQAVEQQTDLPNQKQTIKDPYSQIKKNNLGSIEKTNITLSQELQAHTFELSEKYNVDIGVIYSIMWHESRFIENVKDNINTNGSRDRGLMQINEVNWSWLKQKGLDVNNPYDNIESGVYMLSGLFEKYDRTHALMAYQCGEGRMKQLAKQGYVTKFVQEIAEIEQKLMAS